MLVKALAEILKKVDFDWLAMALPINVFPVPGGPNRMIPFGGPRIPVKMSLFCVFHFRNNNNKKKIKRNKAVLKKYLV